MPKTESDYITLQAAAALAKGQRLTIDSSGYFAVAGLDPTIAICCGAYASGEPALGQLMGPSFEVKVGEAVAAGALLYPAASGLYIDTAAGANGNAEMIALESASGSGSIIQAVRYNNNYGLRVVGYATSVPAAGAYLQGDVTINSDPAATEYIGWVCTVAGSPGTQKGFGVIQT